VYFKTRTAYGSI